MDIEFITKNKDEWVLLVKGEETILNPIRKKLALDESIIFVGLKRDHPILEGIKLIIKGKNVEASFKKAVKSFETELKALSKEF